MMRCRERELTPAYSALHDRIGDLVSECDAIREQVYEIEVERDDMCVDLGLKKFLSKELKDDLVSYYENLLNQERDKLADLQDQLETLGYEYCA